MVTIETVMTRLNAKTNISFKNCSSKNDACDLAYCEDIDFKVYIPNCGVVVDETEDFNTFLVMDENDEVFENANLDEVVKFINHYCASLVFNIQSFKEKYLRTHRS